MECLLLIQDRDGLRTPTKWTPRKASLHLNTNNSNNNNNNNPTAMATTATRMATVKSARRDQGIIPNVNVYSDKTAYSFSLLNFRVF